MALSHVLGETTTELQKTEGGEFSSATKVKRYYIFYRLQGYSPRNIVDGNKLKYKNRTEWYFKDKLKSPREALITDGVESILKCITRKHDWMSTSH